MARVPYVAREQLASGAREVYERIAAPRGGRLPRVFELFLNCPEMAVRIADVGAYVSNTSSVPVDARETAILATVREAGCQYEFTHHVPAAQQAGVRDIVIEGIKGRTTRGMIPKESVFVDYAKQVVNRRVNDPTFQAVEHLLGRQGAVELTMAIGYYLMISNVMMALGMELEPDLVPLMPEP